MLFQIKAFGWKNKETTLARYLIKITARPSFSRNKNQSNIKSSLNIGIENMLQRFNSGTLSDVNLVVEKCCLCFITIGIIYCNRYIYVSIYWD